MSKMTAVKIGICNIISTISDNILSIRHVWFNIGCIYQSLCQDYSSKANACFSTCVNVTLIMKDRKMVDLLTDSANAKPHTDIRPM